MCTVGFKSFLKSQIHAIEQKNRNSNISWFVILCRYFGKVIYVLSSIVKNIDDYKVTCM